MKTLIITRGIPGAGKTTFAHAMADIEGWPVISADDYFMIDNEYKFNKELIAQAHAQCQHRTETQLKRGTGRVFVANTFTTEREMRPYFDLARQYGYQIFTVIVENRHGNTNVHDVPRETLEKMSGRFDIKL